MRALKYISAATVGIILSAADPIFLALSTEHLANGWHLVFVVLGAGWPALMLHCHRPTSQAAVQ
jgi:hypothetical protein